MSSSPNADTSAGRNHAGKQGQIDVELGKKFLADHFDAYEGKEDRNFRGLCGHGESSPTGEPAWAIRPTTKWRCHRASRRQHDDQEHDATGAGGHPCGEDFIAEKFLKEHPSSTGSAPS